MVLYHYCSLDNFHKLIESKSIWLSDSSQMNDRTECLWIERYFDTLTDYFDEAKLDDFKKFTLYTYNLNKHDSFIFCLSKENDTLSQWRAYANNGKGVCIGFNFDQLQIPKEIPMRNNILDNTIGISEVIYNELNQRKMILELVDHHVKLPLSTDISSAYASSILGYFLVSYSLIFKNPSFKEEKEWRIIHTPSEIHDEYLESDEKKFDLSGKKYRVSGDRLTCYSILNLTEKFNSKLIPEIILGPKCEVDEKILRKFLDRNCLQETKIVRSNSTYR